MNDEPIEQPRGMTPAAENRFYREPIDYTIAPNTLPVTPATPMEMLSRAVMSGAAPEIIERLFALQERWEATNARKAFDRAIALARPEFLPIIKSNKVKYGTTTYEYESMADIEDAILKALSNHGLSYRFRTSVSNDKPAMIIVTCRVTHVDGHAEENSLPGPADASGSKNPIQAIGSTVTYLQRYTLRSALGLAPTKDDDGAAATNEGQGAPSARRPVPSAGPPRSQNATAGAKGITENAANLWATGFIKELEQATTADEMQGLISQNQRKLERLLEYPEIYERVEVAQREWAENFEARQDLGE
jgi:ERF superfamily